VSGIYGHEISVKSLGAGTVPIEGGRVLRRFAARVDDRGIAVIVELVV
jgi:hypothetical protein